MERHDVYSPVQAAEQLTYNATEQTVHVATVAAPSEPAEGWFSRNLAIIPQTKSAGAAMLVLVSGGMNIAWSLGFRDWTFRIDKHIMICWYIAVIIGALASAFITNRISKKLIYLISAFLVLIGGILFVALAHEYGAIVLGRYLNGFAVGLVFVRMIVQIGEEVISKNRGMVTAILEAGSVSLGIYLQIVFMVVYYWKDKVSLFGLRYLHGIVVIVLAVLAFVMSYFFAVESPVQHLMQHNEQEAINCLRRLHRPFVATKRLEEHKRYIEASAPNGDKGISALVKLCLIRGMIALSFSPFIIETLYLASNIYSIEPVMWPYILYGLLLWLCTYIAAFSLDSFGRRKVLLISALICGILLIAIGALSVYLLNLKPKIDFINIKSKFECVLFMFFVLELSASFFNSSSLAYLTEAFPLHMKPYYIALSLIVEMLVLLITYLCPSDYNTLCAYLITCGVLYLVFFIIGFFCLPETKQDSLQEAQSKFKNILIR